MGNYPWNQPGYRHGYSELRKATAPPSIEKTYIPPRKYTVEVAKLPDRAPADKANRVTWSPTCPQMR